ncbi:GAF domain-containing protein [Fischerella sp.]|uniref:GAF domain-containing protein n=1 Tax=Fischerella sp. TaxID=1191 RepID=UPI0025BBBEC3|nr:GAF domain-containing protein [Fischerella sp.]
MSPFVRFMRQFITGDSQQDQTITDRLEGSTPEVDLPSFSQPDDDGNKDTTMQKLGRPEPSSNPTVIGNSSFRNDNSTEVVVESESYASQDWLFAIAKQMHQAQTIDALFETTVAKVQQNLRAERVLIYRVQSENQGVVLAESLVSGYTPSLKESLPAIAFGAKKPENYQQQPCVGFDNATNAGLSYYQCQILERFQVQASLSLPIFLRDKLFGLLVVQQCSRPRQWQENEIALLHQVVTELRLSLQSLLFRNEQQALARVSDKIRQTSDLETIFQTATREVQKLLNVERVAICKLRSDYFGDFIFESKAGDLSPMVGSTWEDNCIKEHQGVRFRDREPYFVDNIYKAGLSDCHVELLEKFEIKACAIAPIFQGQELWGLLCVYQHSNPRHWVEDEIKLLTQFSNQLGVALQQAQLLEEKAKAVKHKQSLPTIIQKINTASYIERACETAVQEARQLLDVERVAIYKFRPDYFGDFIFESESGGWPKLVGSAWEDTYIKEHQGGRFRNDEPYIINNVYTAGLTDCHLASLEYFGIKSCLVVAIKQGNQLWGLLSAFQHSGPKHWLEIDVNLLTGIALQLGRTLQEREYVSRLETQATEMAKAAQVDHAVAQIVPKILQSQDLDTIFRTTSQAVRLLLKCDRVAICRCNADGSSDLVTESAIKSLDAWQQKYLKAIFPNTEDVYRQRESLVVNNIYTSGYSLEEIESLEGIEVKAYIITPIFKEDKLWGLLGAYQSSEARSWAEVEVRALKQICVQMDVAMRQIDYITQLRTTSEQLAKTAERERLITKTVERIRQSLDLQKTFKTTAREIRNFMEVDRVALFKFDSGYRDGETIAEDVRPGYVSALAVKVTDNCFSKEMAEQYKKGRFCAIEDIYQAGLAHCHIELLSQFQVQANLVVPLLKGEELWGLFCIHQCSGPRQWQEADIEFVKQIAAQLNIAIQQGEYIKQLQQQSQQLAEAAHREKTAKERLQQEVIQLLTVVRPALAGNLTVRAPVTDTEVGTVADAYNNTLGSLRQIVIQMQTAANQVTQISQANGSAIARLAAQAQEQFHALEQALERIEMMVDSTEAVKINAQQVEAAVQQANQTVMAGDAAIDRTVDEMEDIRETVVETNQRLLRLSESSQKISRVVSLISNFTTQTQLLALNAAIEATRAGEFGRGFGVVADEVRSLARQSANAATEIEELVQEIQVNTAEVSMAMEMGIQQVASGTAVVNEARQNLNAIVNATAQISELVTGITHATQEQTQQCQSLSQTMTKVAAIANKTSKDSITISASFKDLLTMAHDLQSKSEQFKVN